MDNLEGEGYTPIRFRNNNNNNNNNDNDNDNDNDNNIETVGPIFITVSSGLSETNNRLVNVVVVVEKSQNLWQLYFVLTIPSPPPCVYRRIRAKNRAENSIFEPEGVKILFRLSDPVCSRKFSIPSDKYKNPVIEYDAEQTMPWKIKLLEK